GQRRGRRRLRLARQLRETAAHAGVVGEQGKVLPQRLDGGAGIPCPFRAVRELHESVPRVASVAELGGQASEAQEALRGARWVGAQRGTPLRQREVAQAAGVEAFGRGGEVRGRLHLRTLRLELSKFHHSYPSRG